MEFEQKKMAIEQGLTPFLNGEPLGYALRLWELKYAGDPVFALVRFVNELYESAGLTAPRTKVLQNLIRALNKLPDPISRAQGQTAHSSGVEEGHDDAIHICFLLVDALIDRLPHDEGAGVRRYMLDHLKQLRQPEPVLNVIRARLSQRHAIAIPIPTAILTQVINLAYVALCEYEGPTKADRTLHEAVLIVEKATPGSKFPVRRLL
ncbi:MAG: hypothetical protein P9F19_00600 [Candidatus Contendobacter sp.]|nr:hypothetical protein [Candidatus Contendobacter sp.]MDG4555886.1 hypothetical protein [Candidatus Contendobacter sp.]